MTAKMKKTSQVLNVNFIDEKTLYTENFFLFIMYQKPFPLNTPILVNKKFRSIFLLKKNREK